MSPLDLVMWAGAVAAVIIFAVIALLVIIAAVCAIRGPQKVAPVASLRPEPRYKRTPSTS